MRQSQHCRPIHKRYHYGSHEQLRQHLQLFVDAYNHARRLKTLRGLTPYEYVARIWTEEPSRFKADPYRYSSGLNTKPVGLRRDVRDMPKRLDGRCDAGTIHQDARGTVCGFGLFEASRGESFASSWHKSRRRRATQIIFQIACRRK
jgi:hypothetical protein